MTPLVLVVGFLGSGKTTYLRGLVPQLIERGLDPHVIINDYQNARVDAELFQGLTDSVTPISGSCVCCGSRDELLAALEGFEHREGRVVILETNGTTDAEELIELLSLEPGLSRFTMPIQLSLVDAQRWQKRFWHNALELEQARTANFFFFSRWDEIDGKRRLQVEQSFEKHGIPVTRSAPAELAVEVAKVVEEMADVKERAAEGCPCDSHEHEHHHDHAAHAEHHFASMQVELPAHLPRAALEEFLAALPDEVVRAKGLVRLVESPEEYFVFQRVDRSDAAQLLPIGRTSRLSDPVAVFIGPHLPEAELRAGIAKLFDAAAAVSVA